MARGGSTTTPRPATVFGYLLFIGALSGGYFYNLTFVQLGLVDAGTRLVGLPDEQVGAYLALLAGLTLVVALATGFLMHHRGWSARLVVKLRLLFLAVLVQTVLTGAAPHLRTEAGLLAWVVVGSLALGVGVPSMFGMACDLVRTRDRGWVAAVITSAAFLPATVLTTDWQIDRFAAQLLGFMVVGTLAMAVLAFVPLPVTAELARQHEDPRFGRGRFVARVGSDRLGLAFVIALLLMFGIYFVDSLGFLRIIDTPIYLGTAWQSAAAEDRWAIGAAHVLAAVLAGILYPALRQRVLFGWVLALFALAQLQYAVHALTTPELPASLAMPLLYAMAVSIYTVLGLALWADFSTPRTIARNTALGVGISGWLASFLSTALSLSWRTGGMEFAEHLRAVAAISLTLLVVTAVLLLRPARPEETG
jgi:hypothetical protein